MNGLPARLELRDVHQSYEESRRLVKVLDGVNVVAEAGEFVTVIGTSGCGKSTLLDIAAGLDLPMQGDVLLDGEIATGRRGHAAYMPQKDSLLPWRRVLDNAALGLEVRGMARQEARDRVAPLLEVFGLEGFEDAYPFQLSGGMRQRAALLRTVVQECRVLLLDEPFGALDSLTRADMQVWLEEVGERFDWTVLLVTHDVREAVFLSDVVYVLSPRPGRVITRVVVDLARPRTPAMAGSPRFSELEAELHAALRTVPLDSTTDSVA